MGGGGYEWLYGYRGGGGLVAARCVGMGVGVSGCMGVCGGWKRVEEWVCGCVGVDGGSCLFVNAFSIHQFYFACIMRCIGLCHYYQGIKRMEKGSRNRRKAESENMLHFKNLSSGVSH